MLKPLGKTTNVGPHRRMPETFEMESVHFPKSLFGRPSFECNAVSRDKYTGAITAQPAMHENFVAGPLANQREELCDLFVGWRRPAVPWNADKVHAAGFRVAAFCFHRAVKFARASQQGCLHRASSVRPHPGNLVVFRDRESRSVCRRGRPQGCELFPRKPVAARMTKYDRLGPATQRLAERTVPAGAQERSSVVSNAFPPPRITKVISMGITSIGGQCQFWHALLRKRIPLELLGAWGTNRAMQLLEFLHFLLGFGCFSLLAIKRRQSEVRVQRFDKNQ